jgi:competence protein ComEC
VVFRSNFIFWKLTFVSLILILVSGLISLGRLFDSSLHIVVCDVGEGDAILIYQKQFQILVDGGPDYSVLTCLQNHMPWWDRKVDVVVMTHPEADHATGLISVFERYSVQLFLKSKTKNSTEFYRVLEKRVGGGHTRVVNVNEVTDLRYNLIHLDIVYPLASTQAKISDEPDNLNFYSIVATLSYKNFKILLTGDIEGIGLKEAIDTHKLTDVDYIKVPHHGSKNGLTLELLKEVNPEVALISVGKKNRFGHPNKETLEMLKRAQVKVRRTDLEGEIELEIP